MKWWSFRIQFVFLSVLLAGTLVSWVGSYWRFQTLDYGRSTGIGMERAFGMMGAAGIVVVQYISEPAKSTPTLPTGWAFAVRRKPDDSPREMREMFIMYAHSGQRTQLGEWGFGFLRDKWVRFRDPNSEAIVVTFPYWLPAGMLTLLLGLLIKRFRRQRRAALQGLCQTCGYDLRASKDRCPECGTAIESLAKSPTATS